jgi:ribosomal protein S6--L-glutamate ligase
MRIGFIMMRRPPSRVGPVMPDVIRLLGEWGVEVEIIYPEERVTELSSLSPRHDLYVLKPGSDLALSVAGALHRAEATLLNPFPVAAVCRDKVITTRVLQLAGVPTPETFVTNRPADLSPVLEAGPLVVKPYRGSQGRGVRVVREVGELHSLAADGGVTLAQRYHRPDGPDRKVFCIGDQIFGVRRNWPALTFEDKLGEPFTVSPELREIALRCRRAFGVEIYGFDVILSDGRPYVVDFSSFPGFKGVPDAALRLADYVYAAGQRALSNQPPVRPSQKSAA